MQKYSSGRRGAPAKGIGRETGARVQIPPSALHLLKNNFKKIKKVVDRKVKTWYTIKVVESDWQQATKVAATNPDNWTVKTTLKDFENHKSWGIKKP